MPTRGHGVRSQAALAVALKLNDWIACDRNVGIPKERQLPGGRLLDIGEARKILAGLDDPGITGAAVWYDGLGENTERLTLSLVLSAEQAGAQVFNYTKVDKLLVDQGAVTGVEVREVLTGAVRILAGRLVINAAGPWLEQAWRKTTRPGPDTLPPGKKAPAQARPTQPGASGPVAVQPRKCVQADGRVTYTDQPCPKGSSELAVDGAVTSLPAASQ